MNAPSRGPRLPIQVFYAAADAIVHAPVEKGFVVFLTDILIYKCMYVL